MKWSWKAGRDTDDTCFHGKYWFVLGFMPKYNSYLFVLILVLLFCFGFRTASALPWYKADAVMTFLCCLSGSLDPSLKMMLSWPYNCILFMSSITSTSLKKEKIKAKGRSSFTEDFCFCNSSGRLKSHWWLCVFSCCTHWNCSFAELHGEQHLKMICMTQFVPCGRSLHQTTFIKNYEVVRIQRLRIVIIT